MRAPASVRRTAIGGVVATLVVTLLQVATIAGSEAAGPVPTVVTPGEDFTADLDVDLLDPVEEIVDIDLDVAETDVADVELDLDPAELEVELFESDLAEAALLPLEPVGSLLGDGLALEAIGAPLCGLPLPSNPLCLLGALDFQFVSRWEAGGKVRESSQVALVNVPTALNVDGDIFTDLVATLEVFALDQFRLRIERAVGETAALPVRVEAIVSDPTQALPRDFLNFGYDARSSRAPKKWQSVISLPETADPDATTLNIATTVDTPGASLNTLGGLFNGKASQRVDPMSGNLRFAPVPTQIGLGMTLGPYLEVRAGSSSPTTLTGDVSLVEGSDSKDVHVELEDLPTDLSLRYTDAGASQRTVQYNATGRVTSLAADYTNMVGVAVVTKVVANATDLPQDMTLQQLSATEGTFATDSHLGRVEVGYANGGDPLLLDVDHPYARVFEDETLQSYAGRIDGVKSASIKVADTIAADIQLVEPPAGADPRKFQAVADMTGGLEVDALVSNLPEHLTLGYSSTEGILTYNTFEDTVDLITVEAVRDLPFFDRVTKIRGEIADLPSTATVNMLPNSGGVRLITNNPIGRAELLVTSGPELSLGADEFGAVVEDVASHFAAFVRVSGLRVLDVSLPQGGSDTRIVAHAVLDPTPLVIRHETDDRKVESTLSTIPADVAVTIDPVAGTYRYVGDTEIDLITLDLAQPESNPILNEATVLRAELRGVPAVMNLDFLPASTDVVGRGEVSSVRFHAPEGIDEVQALITSGPELSLPAGKFGALVQDSADHFAAFVRVSGLTLIELTTAPSGTDTKVQARAILDPTPLVIEHETEMRSIRVGLSAIPSDVGILVDPAEGTYVYDANAPIDRVTLDISQPQSNPIVNRATRLAAELKGLPADVTLKFLPDVSGAGASSVRYQSTERIDQVDVLLTSGPQLSLPAETYGAVLEDTSEHFAAFVRISGLKHVSLTLTPSPVDAGEAPAILARAMVDPTPLVVTYKTDDLLLLGGLSAIPDDVALLYDPAAGVIEYDGSAEIDNVDVDVYGRGRPLFGEVRALEARIVGVPDDFRVGLKADSPWDQGARFATTDAVDRVDVILTDGQSEVQEIGSGGSGLSLLAVPGEFSARAVLQKIEELSFGIKDGDFEAFLATRPLPEGELQSVDLDVVVNDPDDAVTEDAQIQAHVDELPEQLTLRRLGNETTYSASGRIPLLTIAGDNLPGGVPGESMEGGLHFLRAEIVGVPSDLTLRVDDVPTNGAAEGSESGIATDDPAGFGSVSLRGWDTDPAPTLAEQTGPDAPGYSRALLNLRDDRFALDALVYGLTRFLITERPEGTMEFATGFAPGPGIGFGENLNYLDLDVAGGTTAAGIDDDGPFDLGVKIPNLPLKSTFGFSTNDGIHLDWNDETGAYRPDKLAVLIDLSSKNVGVENLDVLLPGSWRGCIGSGGDCDPQSNQVTRTYEQIPNDFVLVSEAKADVKIRGGRVCLRETTPEGLEIKENRADVYGRCAINPDSIVALPPDSPNRPPQNFVELHDVRFQTLRLEFMSGFSRGTVACGTEDESAYWELATGFRCAELEGTELLLEDDLLKLYLESDARGLSAQFVRIVNNADEDATHVRIDSNFPLRPSPFSDEDYFYGVYDNSPPFPTAVTQTGYLSCNGTHISINFGVWINAIPGVLEDETNICG